MSKLFQVDDGEIHLIVADNPDEALQSLMDMWGYANVEDYKARESIDRIEIKEIPSDRVIPVFDEDSGETITKTAKEWAEDSGFYAGSCY